MKKFNQLSRAEMRNVKGGADTPTCLTGACITVGGAYGTCSQATEQINTLPPV